MKVLLVEDHPITRVGVRQLVLGRWPDALVVEAASVAEALVQLAAGGVDIIVLDLNLPDVTGLEGLVRLRRVACKTPLLVLSAHSERAYATRCLQEGAQGYLNKDRAPQELITALERIAAGGRYITASLAVDFADQVLGRNSSVPLRHEELSHQEYRVMLQLAEGRGITDIAEQMHLSPKTISTYRMRILAKLELQTNVDLARYCLTHGIVTPG